MTSLAIQKAPSTAPPTCNIAHYLASMAERLPDQLAVVVPWRRHVSGNGFARWTFSQLEAESNRLANGLRDSGIDRGSRTVVMVKPGLEFTATIFALFKLGAVPILIDPGMGLRRMVDCIAKVEPEAFIGVPAAQLVRVLHRGRFARLRHVVTVGRRWGWGGSTLEELRERGEARLTPVDACGEETAAILFTSGSTGPPKGVVYEHGMFDAQLRAIRSWYGMEPGEVDMPAFPLFSLFSTAMGMTCVLPQMDGSHPARCNPAYLVRDILAHGVTTAFGSPAIWKRVGAYCVERSIQLPTLRRVLTAGAPIPWQVIEQLHRILPKDADVHTPYGATEALPVASISGRELFSEGLTQRSRRGEGTCVGRPFPNIRVQILRISDAPMPRWDESRLAPAGQRGEIVVSGEVVTKEYDHDPCATALHKVHEGSRIWHRIGDVGYVDEHQRLWFCGRKAHRVPTVEGVLFSVEYEAILNEHPRVARSALVGVRSRFADAIPRQEGSATLPSIDRSADERQLEPVMIVELKSGKTPRGHARAALVRELLKLAQADARTAHIREILFHSSFPVDVRHNAKIHREALADWAAWKLNRGPGRGQAPRDPEPSP